MERLGGSHQWAAFSPLVQVVGLVIGRIEASSAECGGLLHGGVVATPPVVPDGEERNSPAMSLFAEKDCV